MRRTLLCLVAIGLLCGLPATAAPPPNPPGTPAQPPSLLNLEEWLHQKYQKLADPFKTRDRTPPRPRNETAPGCPTDPESRGHCPIG